MDVFEHAGRLTALFGHWPDFHDAELLALRIDATASGGPVLEADLEVAEMSGEVDERGYFRDRQRCRTTLRFLNTTRVVIDEFLEQNVVDELNIRALEPVEAEQLASPWTARRLQVELVPIGGFCAVTFLCDAAEVVYAEPMRPAT